MKKLLLTLVLTTFALVGFAQTDIDKKMSITTQMFLKEIKGEIDMSKKPSGHGKGLVRQNKLLGRRFYAAPDTIDGKVYASCFVRLRDSEATQELEALGVIVQCRFMNGLVTALIPVEKMMEVAAVANVKRINVSPLMHPMTNAAREKTNADDVLTYSNDARAAGLSQGYDGSGVLLGVIDTGIDFQHIAFKDKDGNSRMKRAYIYNGKSATEYAEDKISTPTTDNSSADHGTHTCSTAGGSSVIVSGNKVTVTDDHANATYGGMAPGSDLYLAGIKNLSSTYMSNAMDKIISYADANNMPVVVSNSWGSQYGPHDGWSDFADVTAKYFGDSHPNHICLFAASNDASKPKDGEGGGYHLTKNNVSKSNPLAAIVRSNSYINTDCGYEYDGIIVNAWCPSTNVSEIKCIIYVIDASDGENRGKVLANSGEITPTVATTTSYGTTVTGLSGYYSGSLYAMKDYVDSDKTQLMLYADGFDTRKYTGSSYRKSNYTLAIEIYPSSSSATIDVWGGNDCYFTDYLTTTGHTWTAGDDDMCVSDEATIPDAISVGAHVSKKRWRAYNGSYYTSNEYTVGDIAYFSSYATAELSPTGEAYPCITAPGARIAAGVNHYHTSSVDRDYSFYGGLSTDLVVNSSSSPYGMMEGTSMSTPVAAGIVALWMQAAQSVGMDLTVHDVKDIMQQTAIHDAYTTTGANASHFGNGKIDALAGIQYILSLSEKPTILASKASINFTANYEPELCKTETFTVRGSNLEADISVALDDPSGNFSVSTQSIPMATAADGTDIIVTWTPTTIGETAATLTLSSNGVNDVVISLTGKLSAIQAYSLVTDASTLEDGDKVIVAGFDGEDCYVLGNSQRTNNREATNDVTINADGTLIPGETAQVITLEKEGSDFLLYVGDGYLYAASSGSNYLRTETAPDDNGNAKAAISISNGDATIRFQGTSTRNLLGFNKVNNPKIFSCYGGTSANVLLPRIYREAPIALNNEGRSNTGTIAAYSGKTVNISLLGRTFFKDGSWNTLCLPFDAPIAGGPLEGADVRALYSASLVDDTLTLNFTEAGVVSAIDAGTPYIMKWTNGDNIVNPVFKNVTVTPDVNEFVSNDDKVRFVGTYDFISFDDEDRNILFMGETNTLNYPLAGARIGACHSYFLLDDDSQVKEFVLTFDGDPDGIREIRNGKLKAEKEDVIYNLAGQRVKGQGSRVNGQLPRGIYIVGGKKIFVK